MRRSSRPMAAAASASSGPPHTEVKVQGIEPLEDRRLLAGVTLVTHGASLFSSTRPAWVDTMAAAIVDQVGGSAAVYTVRVNADSSGPYVQSVGWNGVPLSPAGGGDGDDDGEGADSGEAVVVLDWAAAAGVIFSYHSTAAVAAVVMPFLTTASPDIGLARPLVELPIHLIGHSRGGSLVSELARSLGSAGIWVDHLTTLDPYPVSADPAAVATDNVVFADNYRQNVAFPTGAGVAGAVDADLTPLSGMSHTGVHAYYHGTIDLLATDDGDGTSISDGWYGGLRWQGGFQASRIGGGARPAAGVSALAGGQAERVPASITAAQPYSNLGSLSIVGGPGGGTIAEGQPLALAYRYQDIDGGETVEWFLDDDRNPYDPAVRTLGVDTAVPATGATPASAQRSVPVVWSGAGLEPGVYYVGARIANPTGEARYAYVPQPIYVSAAGAQVISRSWTGQYSADASYAGNWSPMGAPSPADRVLIDAAPGTVVEAPAGVSGAAVHVAGGTLRRPGGTLAAGSTWHVAPGAALEVAGDLNLPAEASLVLDLAGNAGAGSAAVRIEGTAALSGRVALAVPADFVPALYESFDVLVAGGISGDPQLVGGRAGAGVRVRPILAGNALRAMAVLEGDADLNGRVDAADYHRIDRGRSLALGGWENGDFDDSGSAGEADDYLILDAAFVRHAQATPAAAIAPAAPAAPATPLFRLDPIAPDEADDDVDDDDDVLLNSES